MTAPSQSGTSLLWDGQDVADLLIPRPVAAGRFHGRRNQTNLNGAIFGGQVLAQAVAAASATADGRRINSLHAYFLRSGDAGQEVAYQVEPLRDGRSFSTRHVSASQDGRPIFEMSCSFHAGEPGWEHQHAMPDVPPPEALQDLHALMLAEGQTELRSFLGRFGPDAPIAVRPTNGAEALGGRSGDRRSAWLRVPGLAGLKDPVLHRAALAWISDAWLAGAALATHTTPIPGPEVFIASIDHAIWFHRPARVDEWLLYRADSPTASGGTGLTRGMFFDRSGRLLATVMQELLMRQPGGGEA